LKPENIRATEQGLFKVLDLGLAKEFNRPADWRFAGTPAYASPEQISGLPSDGRTDQYALAVIVYELLTGRRVFESRDCLELFEMHLTQEPSSPKAHVAELPDSVCAAILQSLRKDPNKRFPTCEAFAVGVGCQLLSAPGAVQHILHTTMFQRMSGDWQAGKGGRINRRLFRFAYARVAVTADALWICRGDDIVRLPIQAIEEIRADPYAIKLRLTIRTLSRVSRMVLDFAGVWDCKAWEGVVSEIVNRKGQMPATNSADLEEFRVKGVVLLAQRPQVRYQLLGAVEAEDQNRWRADFVMGLRRLTAPPVPAFVDTFCQLADIRLAVDWMILVEFGSPRNESVTVLSGLRTTFVMTAGTTGIGMLNTVPAAPGPPAGPVTGGNASVLGHHGRCRAHSY